MAIDFPFARTLVAIQSTFETRCCLSSQEASERSHLQSIQLIHDHWGGVENRNHWGRDALWAKDLTRSRYPKLVANLA